MGQLENILKHQNMVRSNIMKSFEAETSEDSLEKSFEDEVNPFEMEAYKSELTKAELDEFEKAKHQDGDMHPNGKWVWRQSANGGKGDWRVAKPSRGGGSKATSGGVASATTKTNTAAKTSSSTLSDKEKNAFADIMKKNSSHKDAHMNLEQMSDDELRKFANAASVLAGDKANLNDKTRANIKGWMKLAQDEQTARRNNKKTTAKQKDDSKQNSNFDSLNSAKDQLGVNKFWENVLTSNGGKGKNLAGKLLSSMKEYGYSHVSGTMWANGMTVFKFYNKDADKNIAMFPYQDALVVKTSDKREDLEVSNFKTIEDFKKKFDETVLKLAGKNDDKKRS